MTRNGGRGEAARIDWSFVIGHLIQSAYQQYLRRPADSSGLAGWLANLQHGMTDQTLAADILGSDEFFGDM